MYKTVKAVSKGCHAKVCPQATNAANNLKVSRMLLLLLLLLYLEPKHAMSSHPELWMPSMLLPLL